MAEKPRPYTVFEIKDPTPWLDQFIETAKVMVDKCGGTSVEFVINQLAQRRGSPDMLVLAATFDDDPDRLIGWILGLFIRDTYAPWVEVWGLWIRPGLGRRLRDDCFKYLLDWAQGKGAVRMVAILTRSPRLFLKVFHAAAGFEEVGIVIERRL